MAAPRSSKGNPVERSVNEPCIRGAAVVCKIQSIVSRLTLIKPDPANLHARLERMPAADKGKVVDCAIGRTHFMVRVVVVDRNPLIRLDSIVQRTCLRIDERSAV